MSKQFLKSKSKRTSCRRRYKIEKKVRQHAKKLRREAKKNGRKKQRPKDPGVPNSLPFKDKVLQEAKERKEKEIEMMKQRYDLLLEKKILKDLTEDAQQRTAQFEKHEKEVVKRQVSGMEGRNFKTFTREFHKVIDAADVILEVLDARDPLGSRCPQVEKAVLDAGPSKRLVLVLNKIDLVPEANLREWLKYLREELPTVPFKASTQMQKSHLSRRTLNRIRRYNNGLRPVTACLGSELLMKILGNYCRSQDIRTSIRVGIVGFPNVGKSSIINSLKRSRACSVGAVPGVTRKMQEVQLDKHVLLLDSPGVVLAQKTMDEASAALRNAIKIESLDDAIPAVEAILRRTTVEQIRQYYGIEPFGSSKHFLSLLAKRFGRLKRGGIGNQEAAAKNFIRDWTMGKIKYFTVPPKNAERSVHLSAEVVKQMAEEFDIQSLIQIEDTTISNIEKRIPCGAIEAIEVSTTGVTAGTTEGLELSDDDEEEEEHLTTEDVMEVEDNVTDVLGPINETTVNPLKRTKSSAKPSSLTAKKSKAAVLEETGMTADLKVLKGNQCLNAVKKQSFKKMKKKRKRSEKLAETLSESLIAAVNLGSDDNYSFKTDFK